MKKQVCAVNQDRARFAPPFHPELSSTAAFASDFINLDRVDRETRKANQPASYFRWANIIQREEDSAASKLISS